ncbi:EAL domain-containing protein, partial [Cryobacterium sp. MLB-32]|uniref:sensor domain-containing protein n=1 Tax=Cryobacterium sp. MLB-32 TaxID=1529318 RepID=UPI0012E09749
IPRVELIGTAFSDCFTEPEKAEAVYQLVFEKGMAVDYPLTMRHRDGTLMEVLYNASVYRDVDGNVLGVFAAARDVTAARRAFVAARSMLETSLDSLVAISPEGLITDANEATVKAIGIPRVELIGTAFSEYFTEPDKADEIYRSVFERRMGLAYPLTLRHRDGTLTEVLYNASVYRDASGNVLAVFAAARDVTALRRAFEAARSMIESSLDSLVAISPEGLITDANEATVQATGIPRVELIGTAFSECFTEPQKAEAIYQLVFEKGMAVDYPLTMRHRDGTLMEVLYNASVYRDVDGNVLGVFAAARDVTGVRQAQEALIYQAFHDPLTGLHNRAWILDILDADLLAAKRVGHAVGALFVDLDHFKTVNDSLGHAAGDEVLTTVAHRIVAALRPGDRVGRIGGDEFVIVIQDVEHVQDVLRCAERVSASISADIEVHGHRIMPTVSIGIATSTPMSSSDSLLSDADSALFRAKASGRARWHFFDSAMNEQAVARRTLEEDLREGIARSEFFMYYQPIVALTDGRVVGHEALVRWSHPSRGLLHPEDFLEVAAATGLIKDIGAQVLRQVCALLAERPDLPGPISVNVSAVELAAPGWLASVQANLTNYDVDPARIVIDVTETAALSLTESARDALASLRSAGAGIHLDDFGTGSSSLSVLRDLPVTGVKLDVRLVQDLTEKESNANTIAQGVSGLVKGLSLTGIAEGIETQMQADILRAQGWECGQGYLFGRPASHP